jgi:hypothetical protein
MIQILLQSCYARALCKDLLGSTSNTFRGDQNGQTSLLSSYHHHHLRPRRDAHNVVTLGERCASNMPPPSSNSIIIIFVWLHRGSMCATRGGESGGPLPGLTRSGGAQQQSGGQLVKSSGPAAGRRRGALHCRSLSRCRFGHLGSHIKKTNK